MLNLSLLRIENHFSNAARQNKIYNEYKLPIFNHFKPQYFYMHQQCASQELRTRCCFFLRKLRCKITFLLMLLLLHKLTWDCFAIKLCLKRKKHKLFTYGCSLLYIKLKLFHKSSHKLVVWGKQSLGFPIPPSSDLEKKIISEDHLLDWKGVKRRRRKLKKFILYEERKKRIANNNRTLIILDLIVCIFCSLL